MAYGVCTSICHEFITLLLHLCFFKHNVYYIIFTVLVKVDHSPIIVRLKTMLYEKYAPVISVDVYYCFFKC